MTAFCTSHVLFSPGSSTDTVVQAVPEGPESWTSFRRTEPVLLTVTEHVMLPAADTEKGT
jgi:hypothetical protein